MYVDCNNHNRIVFDRTYIIYCVFEGGGVFCFSLADERTNEMKKAHTHTHTHKCWKERNPQYPMWLRGDRWDLLHTIRIDWMHAFAIYCHSSSLVHILRHIDLNFWCIILFLLLYRMCAHPRIKITNSKLFRCIFVIHPVRWKWYGMVGNSKLHQNGIITKLIH